jgi:hypothetical protein
MVADTVLSDLSNALDLIVLEQLPAGGFWMVADSHMPEWFLSTFRHAGGAEPVALREAFPVLDAFLREAEPLWSGGTDGRKDSEPFIIVDPSGRALPVTATAIAIRGRRYLLIQLDARFEDRQRILQTARDHALAHERMIRQLQALQKPIATLARLADDLCFTDPQHAAADGIRQQVDTLRSLLEELPHAPSGATPKGR